MARQFIRPDYASALTRSITVDEALPPGHFARWLVTLIAEWDLSPLYARYELFGRPPYAPELLLALILYGYCTGVISGRAIQQATHESLPFRFLADFTHPNYVTIDRFRAVCLPYIAGFLAQLLVRARREGILQANPTVSIDGSKIHADASKHHAVSYQHACALRDLLLRETADLLVLADAKVPAGMDVIAEITLRLERLEQLTLAIRVIEARAEERYQAELAEYQAKMATRVAYTQETGHNPRGQAPKPPTGGPQPQDQYNFTDPTSRIMKNSTNKGVDQHYNVQMAMDQGTQLVLGCAVSNHANDKEDALEVVDTIPAAVGTPRAAALDTGYYSEANILGLEARMIIPLIPTGKSTHGLNWKAFFRRRATSPPPEDATPAERVSYMLTTALGEAIYRKRKSTVEPTFGTIKETQRFRQFSLRGLLKVTGEWWLVNLAYDLKRLHTLGASANRQTGSICWRFVAKIGLFARSLLGGSCGTLMSPHPD